MSLCARLVDNGKFSASSPEQLLEHAYDEASMHKDAAMGEVWNKAYWILDIFLQKGKVGARVLVQPIFGSKVLLE